MQYSPYCVWLAAGDTRGVEIRGREGASKKLDSSESVSLLAAMVRAEPVTDRVAELTLGQSSQ